MNIRKRNYSTGWCVTLFISCFCLLMFATISRILRVYADLLTSFVIRSYSATSKHERKLLRTPSSKETQCKPCAHWNDHNSQEFKRNIEKSKFLNCSADSKRFYNDSSELKIFWGILKNPLARTQWYFACCLHYKSWSNTRILLWKSMWL